MSEMLKKRCLKNEGETAVEDGPRQRYLGLRGETALLHSAVSPWPKHVYQN